MVTVGVKKQEEKIAIFAKLAKEMFPDINELAIKGAFRFGAQTAVEKSRFSNWSEISQQPESVRRKFSDTWFQESRNRLENMIAREKIDDFMKRIKIENEKFLKNP